MKRKSLITRINGRLSSYPGRFNSLVRLGKFLYIQRVKGFSPPGDEPFMPSEEVALFKEEIAKAEFFVEFGSGGSTVYADTFNIKTISVENDGYYAKSVASRLKSGSVQQIVCDMGLTGEWGMPVFPDPEKAQKYVTAPWGKTAFPQFILVDGRYRVACALESARRAFNESNSATLMFDDYELRPYYHAIEEFLGTPTMVGRAAMFKIGKKNVNEAAVFEWMKDPR